MEPAAGVELKTYPPTDAETLEKNMQGVRKEPDKVTTWSGRLVKGVLYTDALLATIIAGYMGATGGVDLAQGINLKGNSTEVGFPGDRVVVAGGSAFVALTTFGLAFLAKRWIATKKLQDNVHELGEVVVKKEEEVDNHMQGKIDDLSAIVVDLQKQLSNSEKLRAKLNESLQERLKELNTAQQDLQGAVTSLQAINQTVDQQKLLNKELEKENKKLSSNASDLKRQVKKLEAEGKQMQDQLLTFGKDNDQLNAEINKIAGEGSALARQVSDLKQQLESISGKLKESEKENAELSAKISSLKSLDDEFTVSTRKLAESEQTIKEQTKMIDGILEQLKGYTELEGKLGPLLDVLKSVGAQGTA